jgi:hypothetical protein
MLKGKKLKHYEMPPISVPSSQEWQANVITVRDAFLLRIND